ncbi:ATP-dependent RecD-like DNA helicase [Bacteroidota bacterium]
MPLISEILASKFPYSPTGDQVSLFRFFDRLAESGSPKPVLIIKGYAGTGKTTVIATLVNVLSLFNYRYMLLAPTGRAAKVVAGYAKKSAYTIHKIIYKPRTDPVTGNFSFVLQKNYHSNTMFFVDEASMIPDKAGFSNKSLLQDLIDYIFSGNNNRLVLIGDNAQLPPVGYSYSAALDKEDMNSLFRIDSLITELTEVVRQEEGSGILWNATKLRGQLNLEDQQISFSIQGFKDIFRMSSEKFEDGLRYSYEKFGISESIIITQSNWQAVQYNEHIRRHILFYEDEITAGDYLMSVKNNYFWLPEDSPSGFLANGDFLEVLKVGRIEELHGFRFCTLELKMIDFSDQPSFEAKVILDTLHSKSPSLSTEENRKLFESVSNDYMDIDSKNKRKKAIMLDPYLNAIQVKFTYALTCHKSQGGQWRAVFLDQGWIRNDTIDMEYIRWLYTGVTRATDELFLVNFKDEFFT